MNPAMIKWARERAGLAVEDLANKRSFKLLQQWEEGKSSPTRNQIKEFAKVVYIPEGYLYLSEPPDESLESIGLEDFRATDSQQAGKLSPNMLDTIYVCQRRQIWYREHAQATGNERVKLVGRAKSSPNNHRKVAEEMAAELDFGLGEQEEFSSVDKAFDAFRAAAEKAGVLVMRSKYARHNHHRKLDVLEFRGFALSDSLAPLVFVNGRDYEPAQMLTLAHELAHLWIGDSGISSAEVGDTGTHSRKEAWCNRVAAEFLVPMSELDDIDVSSKDLRDNVEDKASCLKVSMPVIWRRLLDGGRIGEKAYKKHINGSARPQAEERKGFAKRSAIAKTIISTVGDSFARALVASTIEGKTLYTEAFRLLGTKNPETVHEIGRRLNVI